MMRYLLILGFILFLNTYIDAQQFLLFQDSGKISIVNYDSMVESDLYQDWRFKDKIELTDNVRQRLVGYIWKSDTLIIFLEDYGKISSMKFNLDSLQPLLTRKVEFIKDNEETLLSPNENPYVTYTHDNIKVISRSAGEIKCYIDSTLMWTKRCRVKTFSCFIVGGGLWNPKISQDRKKLLMIIDGALTEVDVKTGKEERISKKQLSRYEYSQLGRYVMYREDGNINIYDKTDSKVTVFAPWSAAFWIYK